MKHLLGFTAFFPIFSSSALARSISLRESSHLDSTMAPHLVISMQGTVLIVKTKRFSPADANV
jgi:hypothetical protein